MTFVVHRSRLIKTMERIHGKDRLEAMWQTIANGYSRTLRHFFETREKIGPTLHLYIDAIQPFLPELTLSRVDDEHIRVGGFPDDEEAVLFKLKYL